MRKQLLIIFIVMISSLELSAELRLPGVIADGMVLQQKSKVALWGWTDPGEKVKVQGGWSRRKVSAVADDSGKWMVQIRTPKAGGPFQLSIMSNDEQIVLENVLIGEVWLCSGQSNMDMWMTKGNGKAGVLNYEVEVAKADFPEIRLFKVGRGVTVTPQNDCKGTWKICTPENIAQFSAVAYYFGRELYDSLDVPIGLIQTSWGGTHAEAWTSRESLESSEDCRSYLDDYYKDAGFEANNSKMMTDYQGKFQEWLAESFKIDQEQRNKWVLTNFDDGDWLTMNLPCKWETAGLPGFDGVVWFRKHFSVPKELIESNLILDLGPVDDMDEVYLNGKKIGETLENGQYQLIRRYSIPDGLLKPGINVITVRVIDVKGGGGIYNYDDKEHLKIIVDNGPSVTIPLTGEWRYKVAFDLQDFRPIPRKPNGISQQTPTSLYNAMLAPLIPFTIKGAIWYQGEGNRNQAYRYRYLFPLMIHDWRIQWSQGDFPFYYVQIAPFEYNTSEPIAAELRESQLLALSVPNTGMAVTMDVGNINDIHPRDKKTVGYRLSRWALAKNYGFSDIEYSGPIYDKMSIEDNRIRISLLFAEDGLCFKGDTLTNFTIAGKDRVFYPALAKIDGNTVIVWNDQIKNPIVVRYGWSNTAELFLYNTAGLPASPFRTDQFPVSTQTPKIK